MRRAAALGTPGPSLGTAAVGTASSRAALKSLKLSGLSGCWVLALQWLLDGIPVCSGLRSEPSGGLKTGVFLRL